ncbi:hypothetical protein LY90DRAFT_373086, partial [Neocallimastix californiae]
EFSLMKAQAIIASLIQNDKNASAKCNAITNGGTLSLNSSDSDTTTTNPNNNMINSVFMSEQKLTHKRDSNRVNPFIHNEYGNMEDSMEIDKSFNSNMSSDIENSEPVNDICNINEIPITINYDVPILLNTREF